MPVRLPVPSPLRRWARRILQRLRGEQASSVGADPARQDPLLQAGHTLREAREARGIGLRQLAQGTRISTAVLEAMERGWRERLPEAAYLRSMLPLLERHLQLPAGSLKGALPPQKQLQHGPQRQSLLRRFAPDAIDVLGTWQGALVYGFITLGLVYAVNLQQQRLASQGLLSSRPVPPLADDATANAEDSEELLLQSFPDLRPLRQAAAGRGLRLLAAESRRDRADLSLGLLRLKLEAPTRVQLRSAGDAETTLPEVRGVLTLPVVPPFRLSLRPAPAVDGVRWNGRALTPSSGPPFLSPEAQGEEPRSSEYRYPAPTALREESRDGVTGSAPAPRP